MKAPLRWQGLLSAVPIAAAVLVLAELTRLPVHTHRGDPARLLAALAHLTESALVELWIPMVLLAAAALTVAWIEHTPNRLAFAALAALAIGSIAHARYVLASYEPFEWSLAANAGFIALAAALGAAFSWLATGPAYRALPIGAGLAVLSLAVARGHYAFLVGQYPTLHACALQLAFLGLALGLAAMSMHRPSFARAPAIALAPLAVLAVLDLPAAAWARPYVVAYTELGRAADVSRALDRDAEHLLPSELPPPRSLRPDGDAVRRFEAHSGLPALDLDLADYDVLLVMSDATRYDRVSPRTTPNLARLERRAFVFTRAYAPSNGTFASLASILAMAPVSRAELDVEPRFWRGRLRSERTTAIEAIERDAFWVGHDHKECFSLHIRGLEQGFSARVLVHENPGEPGTDREIADRAIEEIRAREGRRWLGLVFFVSPHDDYLGEGTPLERYDRELRTMDRELGRLLDAIDLERTIVIFAGDHGESFGEHGYEHHLTSMHEEQIHVPFVVSIGGRAERVDAPTSLSYVFPWLLLRGNENERRAARAVLSEDIGPMMRELDGGVLSEMIGRERQEAALIWDDHTVLYDVLSDVIRVYDARDPAQQHDLREDRSDLLERFVPRARAYRRWRFEGRRFRFVSEAP